MNLKNFIRDIPDFPAPGILFRDITPLLKDPAAFAFTIEELARRIGSSNIDAIVAVESRGFIFGAPLAHRLQVPFVPIRKPGKLPYESVAVEYSLEYGSGKLEMHRDSLKPGAAVIVIDDVLATGGTALGSAKLIEKLGATVAGFFFVLELSSLRGRETISPYRVECLLSYP